ncbi:MAG: response regulator [Solirubrobacteraceae bacterium]
MPPRPGSGMRVLLVDDAACFRSAARELLECRGYVVAGEANCAAAAVRAVAELEPDAVLLDVQLPDASGLQLADELARANSRLSILLVSAEALSAEQRRSVKHPFVAKSQLASVDLSSFWPAPAAVRA